MRRPSGRDCFKTVAKPCNSGLFLKFQEAARRCVSGSYRHMLSMIVGASENLCWSSCAHDLISFVHGFLAIHGPGRLRKTTREFAEILHADSILRPCWLLQFDREWRLMLTCQ